MCASLCLLTLASLVTSACNPNAGRAPAPATAKNVLLIVIDTLRADKLGCYGNALGLSPNIDKLAGEGFLFEQAFSHAPWTLPATASLLSSWLPEEHGAFGRIPNVTAIRPSTPLLSECLFNQGYETGAIINVPFLHEKYGLSRGFEMYDYKQPEMSQKLARSAGEVTDLALSWISDRKESGRPFFMLAHYFDPHLTYDPPAEFRRKFALVEDHEPDPSLFGSIGDMQNFRAGTISLSSIPLKRLEALYNAEIAYTDQEVGRLIRSLDEMGLRDSTIVVLTSDHGEEFRDHGGFEHGHSHYDELLRIPLIFRNPAEIRKGRTASVVRHMDVAPTLCALAGVSAEPRFRGRLLDQLFEANSEQDRDVLAQTNLWGPPGPQMKSLRQDGYKYIEKTGPDELYHVAGDSRELRNLASSAEGQGRCRTMAAAIQAALDEVKDRLSGAAPQVVTNTAAEQNALDGMGYADTAARRADEKSYDAKTGIGSGGTENRGPVTSMPSTQPTDR